MKHYERSDSCHAIIAGTLRRLRKAAKFTQDGLAEAAGLSRATVAAIEGGRYSSLTLMTLERLANALRVDEASLLARSYEDAEAIQNFKLSPWYSAVKPSADELARVSRIPAAVWQDRDPNSEVLAGLIRLLREHDGTS